MYQGKYSAPKPQRPHRKSALRAALMSFAVCVLIFSVVGGSLAWLMTRTEPIVNVFTYGDIQISIQEEKGVLDALSGSHLFKMVPGNTIEKDPKLNVHGNSEDCWLFVKIEESSDKKLTDYIEYEVAEGWTALEGVDGVYYREVASSTEMQTFDVLKNNQVKVKNTVTLEMLQVLNSENYPKLTFTGYAVQRDAEIAEIDSALEAWALLNPPAEEPAP